MIFVVLLFPTYTYTCIMDRIAILLVLLTEGNYIVLNAGRVYAYYDRPIEMIKQSIKVI